HRRAGRGPRGRIGDRLGGEERPDEGKPGGLRRDRLDRTAATGGSGRTATRGVREARDQDRDHAGADGDADEGRRGRARLSGRLRAAIRSTASGVSLPYLHSNPGGALMERVATRLGAAVAIVAVLGAVAAFYAVRASGAEHLRVVMTANNKTLGKKILVNRKGMTLYSLSVEHKGNFICTGKTCLSLWKPLTVPKGTVATGVAHLTVVRRPDGRWQVAYRGGPL